MVTTACRSPKVIRCCCAVPGTNVRLWHPLEYDYYHTLRHKLAGQKRPGSVAAQALVTVLKQLSIRNFVLIDRLDVEFESGMTALTGETGAGKSIVLDALARLGARRECDGAGSGESRPTSPQSLIFGHAAAREWLAAQAESDGDHVVCAGSLMGWQESRPDQRSARPVTELRELGATLLELHAQHEHQALLRSTTQRELLDRFADAGSDYGAGGGGDARDAREALTHAKAPPMPSPANAPRSKPICRTCGGPAKRRGMGGVDAGAVTP